MDIEHVISKYCDLCALQVDVLVRRIAGDSCLLSFVVCENNTFLREKLSRTTAGTL